MATEIIMPKNGMDMTEGTLIRWMKNIGDSVEFEESLMEIETDKVTMESESPATGVLLAKYFEDGAVIPVLTVMGYIGKPGEEVPANPNGAAAPAAAAAAPAAPVAAPVAAAPAANNGECAATPFAKKLAEEKGIPLSAIAPTGVHGEIKGRDVEAAQCVKATPLAANVAKDLGVDLSHVAGSGFAGKVTRSDVVGAQAPAAPAAVAAVAAPVAAPGEEIRHYPMNGMRKTISKRMTQSHDEIPTVSQNVEVDVTALMALRAQLNDGLAKEQKITVNDLVLRATAIAVSEHERFRMRIEGNTFASSNLTHVGMAVGLAEGLIVPVIRNADRMDVFQISAAAKDLGAKAKHNRLAIEEMGNASITVSNMGMYGVHSFTPIINQPESSILGVCAAIERLALENGNVVVKQFMMLSHTYDHRIVNGTEAAAFELRVKYLLEHPAKLLVRPDAL